jgi:DNA mismatch repair ATPase MutL
LTLADTSKQDDSRFLYGANGVFLASLASLSHLAISSRQRGHIKTSYMSSTPHTTPHTTPHKTPQIYSDPVSLALRFEHGTKVAVSELFLNIPVRLTYHKLLYESKSDISRQWEKLKYEVIALLLYSRHAVKIILRNQDSQNSLKLDTRKDTIEAFGDNHRLAKLLPLSRFQFHRALSILSQSLPQYATLTATWSSVQSSTTGFRVEGMISTIPTMLKCIQFLSFGNHILHSSDEGSIYYDCINRLFAKSSFGIPHPILKGSDLSTLNTGSSIFQNFKTMPRWPMFALVIFPDPFRRTPHLKDSIFKNQDQILLLITNAVQDYLHKNGFIKSLSRPISLTTRGLLHQTNLRSQIHFNPMVTVENERKLKSSSQPASAQADFQSCLANKTSRWLQSRVRLANDNYGGDIIHDYYKLAIDIQHNQTDTPKNASDGSIQSAVLQHNPQKVELPLPNNASKAQPTFQSSEQARHWDSTWNNPTFQKLLNTLQIKETTSISSYSDFLKSNTHNVLKFVPNRRINLSRADLKRAKVIAQLDRKYIIVRVSQITVPIAESNDHFRFALVVIDQHAADERVRLEQLLNAISQPVTSPKPGREPDRAHVSKFQTVSLSKPVEFALKVTDHDVFERHRAYFAKWGIKYNILIGKNFQLMKTDKILSVHALPEMIAQSCTADIVRFEQYIRAEAAFREDTHIKCNDDSFNPAEEQNPWVTRIKGCPNFVLQMLSSRACRSKCIKIDIK